MLRLGPIRSVFLFGGGSVLVALAEEIRTMGLDVRILTSPRLAAERLDGGIGFERRVQELGFSLWVHADLHLEVPPLTEVTAETLGISLGAAWIFRKEVIDLFGGRLLNCHGSCLPEDRGGGGFSWRIMRGERRGRCVLHQVDEGVDSGPLLCSADYTFPDRCRVPADFFKEQRARDLSFLVDFVKKVKRGYALPLTPQEEARATYWPRLDTLLHGVIDWRWNVQEIERFICAFDQPYPGASTFVRGGEVRLRGCSMAPSEDRAFHSFQSGLIYRIHGGAVYVACCAGNLRIGQVTHPDGTNAMVALSPGDRFWTPAHLLERARITRVFHSSTGEKHYQVSTPEVMAPDLPEGREDLSSKEG